MAARNAAASGEPSDLERQLAQSIDLAERRKLEAKLDPRLAALAANGNGTSHTNGDGTKPYAASGIPAAPVKIPMDRAVVDAVMVQAAMKETGEQSSDEARQDLVSTVLIATQLEGWVTMWKAGEHMLPDVPANRKELVKRAVVL